MSEVADLLDAAANIIRQRGWAQGNDVTFASMNGPVCAAVACQAVAQAVAEDPMPLLWALYNVTPEMGLYEKSRTPRVAIWNDDPSRTETDVLLAFKKAAYEARM